MKKGVYLALAFALAAFGACSNTAHNGSTANHHGAAHADPSNADAANHHAAQPGAGHDMPGMRHGEMPGDPNAAGQPYDLQFIDTMIAHHEGAIEMARLIEGRSERAELQAFARKIALDQEKEIARMKSWRAEWFPGAPPARNMEMPGMADSMKTMTAGEMKRMEAARGRNFDLMFLEMMTPHHEGALQMAKDALAKAEHAELKTLAQNIIREQQAEIAQMQVWKSEWSK